MSMKLVLLPGLDGTGKLFAPFLAVLPDTFEAVVVSYPPDKLPTYAELLPFVEVAASGPEPFVLLAESFSSPLAIQYAATRPSNLKAIVIVAGFVTSPVKGWRRAACLLLAPILFRLPIPWFATNFFLIGERSQPELLSTMQEAIASVQPEVLTHRLRSVLACDAREELRGLTIPLLYIRAKQDLLIGGSSAAEFLRIQSRTVVAEADGPHLILQRQPWETAGIIVDFLQRVL